MSEHNRQSQEESSFEETGFDIAVEIKKIQTHLGFLEKKLDMLVAQAQERGGGGGGNRPQGRDFRPRRDFRSGGGGGFRRREGGFDRDRGPRSGGGEGGFKPRREGGFDRDRGPRSGGGEGGGNFRGGDRPFKKRRPSF